jgi:hypothetical protein
MRTEEAAPPGVRLAVRGLEGDSPGFKPQAERFLGTRDWRQITFRFTPPTNVSRVALTLEGGEAASGLVWLDQCALVRDEANLLKNGSFETGENGRRFWLGTPQPGVAFAADSDDPLEGNQSFKITYGPGVGQSVWQSAPVEEGATYRLEVWLRIGALGGKGVNVTVKDAPTNGEFLSKASRFLRDTEGWTPVRVVFAAPEGIYSVVVSMNRPRAEEGAGGTVWLDACSLTRKQPPPPEKPASRVRRRPRKPAKQPASGESRG